MSDNNEKNENGEKKEGIEKFYEFDKHQEKTGSLNFMQDAQMTLQRVQAVKQKLQQLKAELEKKIAELKKQNNSKENKGDKSKDMAQEDLKFCELALQEHPSLVSKNAEDENTLNEIILTKTEKPYNVIVDIALKPLPSDRNKDKDKDKDKDNNDKDKGNNKDKSNSNKLSKDLLNQLRMGKPLSYKPKKKDNSPKSPQSEKDMLLMMKQRNLQAQNR